MKKLTKLTFKHPYESVVYLAGRNAAFFCNGPALKLFQQALKLARTDAERDYCQRNIKALEGCK